MSIPTLDRKSVLDNKSARAMDCIEEEDCVPMYALFCIVTHSVRDEYGFYPTKEQALLADDGEDLIPVPIMLPKSVAIQIGTDKFMEQVENADPNEDIGYRDED